MRKALILLLLCVVPLVFVSCGKKSEVRKVDAAGNLYVQGVDFMKQKKYDKAIANFNKIRENYPFDPLALVADVKLGDAHFAKKEYQMAAVVYEDFANSHPEDDNAPYVLKRLGECYEKLSPSIDRDQANTYKAVERFTFLKNRYPTSSYAKDIDTHIKVLTEKLASREFYVGEFYHRTDKYNSAIMRLEYLLSKFPESKDREKALYYLSLDYKEMNRPDKSQFYAEKLRQEFPKSAYILSNPTRERKILRMSLPGKKPVSPGPSVTTASPGPSVTTASPGPSVTTASPPQTPPPAVQMVASNYSYEERKKREIDLRPLEPPGDKGVTSQKQAEEEGASSQEGRSAPGAAAPSTPEDAAKPSELKPSDRDVTQPQTTVEQGKRPRTQETPKTAAQGREAAGPKSEPETGAGNDKEAPAIKGESEKKQAGKQGSKNDSLGFFFTKEACGCCR